MKKLLLIVLTVILANVNFAMATEEKIDFSFTGNGYFIKTPIDINQDGIPATLMNFSGQSKELGSVSLSILADSALNLDQHGIPKSCVTSDGHQGILVGLVRSEGVIQLESGDQLFTKATSLSACLNISQCFDEQGRPKQGCTFQAITTAKFFGGTGKFACATGVSKHEHTRTVLEVDSQSQVFGNVSDFKMSGTVHIPSNCNK